MKEKEKYVTMVNSNLDYIKRIDLPSNINVHWYEKGNENIWVAINQAADKYNIISNELFYSQFNDKRQVLSERQCYFKDKNGTYFSTGTAWEGREGEFKGYGRPHWIAVLPEFQGNGFGKAITIIVCNRLVSLGYEKAYLTTSTCRPIAIKMYKKIGFEIVSIEDP